MDRSRFKPTPILRERRRDKCTRLELTNSSGQKFSVMVRDISSRGLSAAALDTPPPVDSIVRAALANGTEVWGLVRWNEGNLFGVEFDTER